MSFLAWKSLCNVSTACYDYNIFMVKALMPRENKLSQNFYVTKKQNHDPRQLPKDKTQFKSLELVILEEKEEMRL